MQATVNGVPAKLIPDVWDRVEPILSRAILHHTDEDANEALHDLLQERSQLWVLNDFDAVCLTQIVLRQTVKVLWVYYVAGDKMDTWLDELVKTLSAFGQYKGCNRMEFTGRPGWQKTLKAHGFNRAMVTMRLDLNGQKN